ncbi:caspase family protein [Gloeothece verrucosa]|uniref:Peptidase C14 caspase catalytic subunit p20 n=1 Tax=Gloeothece verrucosa (strain PCC 7822) TaxID=497965 RepID=E0U5Z6_GLOV7|nr:caspase family protein [Gloeothece verrucosa]ADN17105.1 peptidase C14 caspase catalytic subunit p20 [Gloeothece verrucosa PCC 7822]
MGLDRRTFLQQAGRALLALGVSQTGLSFLNLNSRIGSKINRFTRALAEPTPRKLALLVGINEYVDGENLKGCITDVELQQELLIHRFGFVPSDIVSLTGEQATREKIETAFLEHLIQQAQPSDVVVFHFSGYGSRVKLPTNPQTKALDNPTDFKWVKSFIPKDGIFPTEKTPLMNGLLFDSLMLLAESLPTEKITLVLDTSHDSSGQLLQGNLRTRSLSSKNANFNREELAFIEQLQEKVKGFQNSRKNSPFTGVILNAANNDQMAVEIQGNNWSAGLFTYALTQYLWQVTPASNILITLSKTTQQVAQLMGPQQVPTLNSNSKSQLNGLAYHLMPSSSMGAEGVLTKIVKADNKITTAQVRLTGLPPTVVHNYGLNSRFKLIGEPNKLAASTPDTSLTTQTTEDIIVQVASREGLTATVVPLEKSDKTDFTDKIGQKIQESLRVFPRHLTLVVALDQSLKKIERVDATSAFSGVGIVASVINAGENFADCLFARVDLPKSPSGSEDSGSSVPDSASVTETIGYGLLWSGGGLIPNTVGKANEAVKSAIQRLTPQLQTLLAAKLWRLTLNQDSSGLGVSATLEKITSTPQPLIYRQTRRVADLACNSQKATNSLSLMSDCPQALSSSLMGQVNSTQAQEIEALPKLSIGTPIQYRLQNWSEQPIYCLLFALDASGSAITLYSPQPIRQSAPAQDHLTPLKQPVIEAGKSLIIPQPLGDLYWRVSGPQGLVEVFIVCSLLPFEKTLQALAAKQSLSGEQEQILTLPNPLEVAQALLTDLHTTSAIKMNINGISADSYALDVNAWATLSFIYQVVE